MRAVWIALLASAVLLAARGCAALRAKGVHAPVFHNVGIFLLVMAAGTAVFPSFLKAMGPFVWAGAYVASALALLMTVSAVRKARRLQI